MIRAEVLTGIVLVLSGCLAGPQDGADPGSSHERFRADRLVLLTPADIRAQVDAGGNVTLPLGLGDELVQLAPESNRAPGMTCGAFHENGTYERLECPPERTYKGFLVRNESIRVLAILDANETRATMTIGDETFHLQPCESEPVRENGTRLHWKYSNFRSFAAPSPC